jgi:hypothetical protein
MKKAKIYCCCWRMIYCLLRPAANQTRLIFSKNHLKRGYKLICQRYSFIYLFNCPTMTTEHTLTKKSNTNIH